MLSFISSFFSFYSTQSIKPINEFLLEWGNKPIASCVLGISKIGWASNLTNSISHIALLLLNKKIDYLKYDEIEKEYGILIEYGDYNPNMCKSEKEYTTKGYVIYRYGDNGGLRYYVKKYSEFIEQYGDIGYIDLNIDEPNQKNFGDFINNIAKLEDNKWIQKNYSTLNFSTHNFSIEALKELKPSFHMGNAFPKDQELAKYKSIKKLNFIPPIIKNELIKFNKI